LRDLWRESGDEGLLSRVSKILRWTEAQVREHFEKNSEEDTSREENTEKSGG